MLNARAARWAWLALLLLLLGVAGGARAEPQAGRRVALVVGNGSYRSVDRLVNAANDARLIASTLRGLGFSLVGGDAQLDLDREHFSSVIRDFGRELAGAEVGLFYYSGHGLQVQGVNWLVPVDANPTRPQDLDFQMVDADLVLRQMDGAGTKLNLVLLDACRNNPFARRGLRAMTAGLAEMRAPEGTLISYATQPGSVAADGAGVDSPYTLALASAMRKPGLDIFRVFNEVGLQVKRNTGGAQQPWVSNSPIAGDFHFSDLPGAVEAVPALRPAEVVALARPPEPGLAVPAVGATSRLLAAVRGQPCSILQARDVGSGLEVSGVALQGAEWNRLRQLFPVGRGVSVGVQAVEFLPAFACEAVDVLGPAVLRTWDAGGGRLLTLTPRSVGAGAAMVVTLRGDGGRAVIMDVFQPDGTVQHLASPKMVAGPGGLRVAVAVPPGAVPGPRLLVVVVSAAPLALGARPTSEATGGYLAALRRALEQADGVLVDVAPFAVRGVAVPARVAGAPSRCSALLQRAGLGEELSEAERGVLRTQCR